MAFFVADDSLRLRRYSILQQIEGTMRSALHYLVRSPHTTKPDTMVLLICPVIESATIEEIRVVIYK
jgi:hypothetical protein